MNAIMDRPTGSPMVSRDGVSIAEEIELECPFENMGAQILREVARQTNEVAGDGTTTATVLADALVQDGLRCLAKGSIRSNSSTAWSSPSLRQLNISRNQRARFRAVPAGWPSPA